MTTEELLRNLEPQTHAQRIRAMVTLGRQKDAASQAIIAELERGGFYERSLALYACCGSRDGAHVLRALNDPSRLLRGMAVYLVPLACDDAEAARALVIAPPALLTRLLGALRSRGRVGVTDTWLSTLTPEEPLFTALLSFASATLAEQLLARYGDAFRQRASESDWRALARRQPTLAAALLREEIAATREPDGRLLWRVNAALPTLAAREPDAALAIVSEMRRLTVLLNVDYDRLASRRPLEMADLILSEPPDHYVRNLALGRRIQALSAEQVIELYRRNERALGWGNDWFKRLAPGARGAVFEGLGSLLSQYDREATLAYLPSALREREARKHLAETDSPVARRIAYASLLPWDEARGLLDPYLRASEVATRAAALRALIGAVRYNRSHMDDALAEVVARRNEQDSVRGAMLTALRGLPPGVWNAQRLPVLATIIRSALDDVSLSGQTGAELFGLPYKLLPAFPDWASEQLALVMRERRVAISGRGSAFTPAAELRLAQAIAPLLELWATRFDDGATLTTVEYLVTRPAAFALVAPAITSLLTRTTARAYAQRALTLLHERAPAEFARLVPVLLAEDPGWITFSLVFEHLARNRQDLLTPYLTRRPYAGRWGLGKKPYLPELSQRLVGATAAQQERYADAAMAIASDARQGVSATTNAIKSLALLPAINAGRLATLANDPRAVARTTALLALARMDQPDGLPTIIAALDDDRARIAIHALRRYVLAMPPQQALNLLRGVSLDRVTVAKEVIRLIGDLPAAVGYPELLALAGRDLHRDTRIALLTTLDTFLDRAQSWELLDEATRSPVRDIALAPLSLTSLASPFTLATTQSVATQRQTLRLLASLVTHPDVEARRAVWRYCAQVGVADETATLSATLIGQSETAAASAQSRAQDDDLAALAQGYFGVCAREDTAGVTRVIRALLPRRRALEQAISLLTDAPRVRERRLLPILQAAVAALATDRLATRFRVDIAIARYPADDLATLLTELANEDALDAEVLMRAVEGLLYVRNRSDAERFYALEPRLGASDDPRLRRLALAILESQAKNSGRWREALRARLLAYRADTAPLVAAAAQFIFPDEEGE